MRAALPIHGIAQDTKGFYKFRSAGLVLRSQEGSGKDRAFALCARGFGDRLQCLLRTDPAPLGVWGAPRERSCAR
jgi:hypothetical protein